ncbi:uncharacterized protein I206_105522 [Kwoniella pini CBS 10737]|uniref:Origin recognition complex subunit 1 n=1 Tax=Kwoniella pini CBS 10737 TaxID=1296096 RepID=A0A1B9I413_9TREE|nr:uncharacterized protein I206_03576 [Kwoniella pini CBS 10737]OCF50257.1 hypothetical protein I206_03576 [Kwoniella pini CBS 10737]
MTIIPSTPRRSTRGNIFTPSPTSNNSKLLKSTKLNTIYKWNSAPLNSLNKEEEEEEGKIKYNSFSKIIKKNNRNDLTTITPSNLINRKIKIEKEDEESRFTIGDGVLINLEGGNQGVAILIGLYEDFNYYKKNNHDNDDQEKEEEEEEENDDNDNDDDFEEKKSKMMAEIHWAFRKSDLPSIMKNVNIEENEVLLAASLNSKPVTSIIPIEYLIKTIPIYSKQFYRDQFPETKSKVKGWSYIRQGIYWCYRAYDKFAKGGRDWKIDIDFWRENGKKTSNWNVPFQSINQFHNDSDDDDDQEESEDDHGSLIQEEQEEEEEESDQNESSASEEEEEFKTENRKRKRVKNGRQPRKKSNKKLKRTILNLPRKKKKPHPKSSTKNNLPCSEILLENLPIDPYERALRLLHVGSTPESLPCREEEFIDVLSKVEEGVESGGGGCLYIAGVPGTGKTATVHAVVKELKRKAEDGELSTFSYVEINGLKIPSPQHAYSVLWEAISGSKGASSKTALKGLENHFSRKGGGGVRGPRGHTFVVLMDELDQLLTAKQDVVYNFFNWPTMRDSQLFVIAVANRMDLPQHLAAKIKSRIGLQTILFQPYDRASLISIVQSRLIPHPLSPSGDPKVLLPDAIALAATKMAGTNGDARRVLDACRRAVEVTIETSKKNPNKIFDEMVNENQQHQHPHPHPVTAKEMMLILNSMSNSTISKFINECSINQKMLLTCLIRCIRREGINEIFWKNLKNDFDNLLKSFNFFGEKGQENDFIRIIDVNENEEEENNYNYNNNTNLLLSNSELLIILNSLISSHALIINNNNNNNQQEQQFKIFDEKKIILGLEIGECGRVLINQGENWRRALAGV